MKEPSMPYRVYEKLEQAAEDLEINELHPDIARQIRYLRAELQRRIEKVHDPITEEALATMD